MGAGAGVTVDPQQTMPMAGQAGAGTGPTFGDDDAQAGQASWAAAATPPTGTSPAAQQVQQAAAADKGANPDAPDVDMGGAAKPPDVPAPTAPVVTSSKPGGIAGVMQSILGALVGKTTPEYGTDQYGNKYVKQATATGGEQWRRLAGEAIVGAAEGLKAGRGAGNMGAAAAAGVEAGAKLAQGRQQQEQQMTAEARAQNLEQANAQMQRMSLAEQSLRLTRLQQEVDAPTIQASKDLATTYAANGEMVGHVNNLKEGAAFLKENPDHFAQLIQQQRVGYVPTYTTDPKTGKAVATGMDIYLMKDGWRKDVMPPGTAFQHYNDATGQIETYHTSSPMSAGEITDMTTQAIAQSKKAQADAAEAKQKAQDEADKLANTATERKLKTAQTAEAYATTEKSRAEAAKAAADAAKTRAETGIADGADPNLTHQTIVNGMLDGSVDINKAVGVFRDPHAREQYIAEAKQRDPSWTMDKYRNMMDMRKDLMTGNLGKQTDSFNAFLGHAAGVDAGINTLRNSDSPLINRPINWLRKNATNNTAVTAMLPEIDATRNEFQNFLTNHALQKSEIERGEKLLSEDQSPAQMQAAIKSFMQVALTKMGAIQYKAAQVFGDKTPQLISPQNQQAIRSLGLEPYAANYGLLRTGATPPAQQSAPVFSPSAWLKANPNGDVNAAIAAAKQKGYQVTQ